MKVKAAGLALGTGLALFFPGLACGDHQASSCGPPFLEVDAGAVSGKVGECSGHYSSLGAAKIKVGAVIKVSIYHTLKPTEATLPYSTDPRVVGSSSRSTDGRSVRFRAIAPGTADLVVPTSLCPAQDSVGTATPSASPSVSADPSAPPLALCQILRVDVG
jgi:hypothetical protein